MEHRATFDPPVFRSRVTEARARIAAAGAKWVCDDDQCEFVGHYELPDGKVFHPLPATGWKRFVHFLKGRG